MEHRARVTRWMRAFVSANASVAVGALLIGFAVIALVGWVFGIAMPVQPSSAFPPLRVVSALGLLSLGVGISASSSSRWRPLAIVSAWVAIVIGSLPLQRALGFEWLSEMLAQLTAPARTIWNGESPAQMAISSAVFVTLGGCGLLAIVSRRRGMVSSITLAASGGIILLLATTVVAGPLFGVGEGVTHGPLLGSSLQSTVCAIILAMHYNALAWTKQAGFSPPPAWLPLSVGAGSLVTVLFMWRALLMSEEAQLAEQSRVAARAMRSAMNRQLMVAQRSLRRLARYSADVTDSTWTSVATQMVEDVSGLNSVIWLDSLGHHRAGDQRRSVQTVASVEATLAGRLLQLRAAGDGRARFLSLDGDSTRAVMVVPRCRDGICDDLFVGVVDSRAVLESIVADTVLGFNVAIGNDGTWFRSSGPLPRRALASFVVEPVILAGPSWRLGVWPSARTSAVTPSSLSDLVLLLGIAVSVLLALALRLAQSVSQTARQDERDKLDRALQTTTDGLWEWDIATNLVTRSPQLWRRLGYGSGVAWPLMDDWLALIHPQDRPQVERRLADHLAQRVDAFDASYRVRNAMGRWHEFVDRGRVVLRAADGTPIRLLGMFADITDRRHAEESLRQAETMSTMGRLAARIAHEINNPLAGIQSAFLLIKDAIPASHPHAKYVGAIEREVARISQVTRQLYETYRPETESSHHAPVQTVVGDAVVFLEQVNRNTGVRIAIEFGGIAAVVRLSDSILRQCVYNLVQNAIEASPAGATVTVLGSIEDRDFVFRVRDSGPGVPLALRERVFDPFVSTKPSQLSTGGMGLGLSLVRRAVEASGGSVEIGDAPDGGAEFIVMIPLAELPAPGVTV